MTENLYWWLSGVVMVILVAIPSIVSFVKWVHNKFRYKCECEKSLLLPVGSKRIEKGVELLENNTRIRTCRWTIPKIRTAMINGKLLQMTDKREIEAHVYTRCSDGKPVKQENINTWKEIT